MSTEIAHDPDRRRFTHERDGQVSYLVYRQVDERTVDFVSTYTPPALRGRGIAARIVRQALEWADGQGYKVVPSCWFVAEYVERDPGWKRILA
ncbi:MAG TPA: GNAT family N-acetyltransferase [Thermoanaerobaculia bacterium]|nr:GNAT family N-acetyltransferase [Thermoanaerobaculia bacterium]